MHVLFLAEDFPEASRVAGGVRVSVRTQAEGLARRGRVTVAVLRRVFPPLPHYRRMQKVAAQAARPSGSERSTANAPAAPAGNLRVLRYAFLHVPFLWPITDPPQILALGLWAILRHGRDTAVLHAHFAYPSGVVAAVIGRLLRRPSVVTVYGSDIHRLAFRGNRAQRWWTRTALRSATRVVAVSRSLVSALAGLGIDGRRCRYVPSGVDLGRFAPPAAAERLRADLGLPPDAHIFLAINLFVPIKGHVHLVDAMRLLSARRPESYLVMTSDGPNRGEIEARVGSAGIEDRVRFTGFLDYDDIPKWIAAADTLVLPSLDEGMPLSVLEGFACGKPLVGSRVGGIPELVSDERYGILVPPADPESLAAAMEQAIDRDWDVEALRARAESFGWPAVVDRLAAVYAELYRPGA